MLKAYLEEQPNVPERLFATSINLEAKSLAIPEETRDVHMQDELLKELEEITRGSGVDR